MPYIFSHTKLVVIIGGAISGFGVLLVVALIIFDCFCNKTPEKRARDDELPTVSTCLSLQQACACACAYALQHSEAGLPNAPEHAPPPDQASTSPSRCCDASHKTKCKTKRN